MMTEAHIRRTLIAHPNPPRNPQKGLGTTPPQLLPGVCGVHQRTSGPADQCLIRRPRHSRTKLSQQKQNNSRDSKKKKRWINRKTTVTKTTEPNSVKKRLSRRGGLRTTTPRRSLGVATQTPPSISYMYPEFLSPAKSSRYRKQENSQ